MTDPRPPRSRWATLRWIALLVLMVGGIALFGLLVYLSGPEQVFAEIVRMGIMGFLAVVLCVVASMLAWSLSWYTLLRGAGIATSFRRTVSPLLAGFTVTYITPSAYLGGEPVRAYWVARDQGVPMARVMATVVVERILAGFAMIAFASIGAMFAVATPQIPTAEKGAIAVALGTLALLLIVALIPLTRNARWLSGVVAWAAGFLPGRQRVLRAAAHVADMEDEIHRAFTQYRGFTFLALGFQLLTVFFNYIRPQIFFFSTQRALFTFPQLSLYFTLSIFVNALLWFVPGGFGLTDGGRVGIFKLLGIPASGAVAFNVVFRFVDLILVAIGVQLLVRRGLLSLRRGRIKVEVDQDPPAGQGTSSNPSGK